jgi:hypothetical protein
MPIVNTHDIRLLISVGLCRYMTVDNRAARVNALAYTIHYSNTSELYVFPLYISIAISYRVDTVKCFCLYYAYSEYGY